MVPSEYFENMAVEIASLDKISVISKIKNFNGRFKLDFTEDYLRSLSLDRLRHILLAALITNNRKN